MPPKKPGAPSKKTEQKKKAKQKKFGADERDSDCILHGYIKKQGGPFGSAWQTRYVGTQSSTQTAECMPKQLFV